MTLQLPLEERVTNLEDLMAQLMRTTIQTSRNVNQLSQEMREFKDEMREFKDEMREFKDEMREFKDEMGEFKDESRRIQQNFNKQLGELSNKMGTLVEDLVAPSIGRVLRTVIGCPDDRIQASAIRVKKTNPANGQQREFDAIAVCGEYLFINETKSRLRPEDVTAFVQRLPEARGYFPEYGAYKLIGGVASLYVDESVVRFGERLGLIVMGFGEEAMDVLNSPEFQPQTF
ncbi:MAG: hypothetical protein KDE19_09260 [Caldilineaceae bacterium]|nr:hypothetical protein [Caldilineaceae bacterium]